MRLAGKMFYLQRCSKMFRNCEDHDAEKNTFGCELVRISE